MANTIDLSQFHEVFFEESFEGLAVMESGLLEMDPSALNEETINNVFRAAHSIKGGAATFGFQVVADFTHGLETLLDEVRSGTTQVTDELVQLLLESVDFLKHLLQESHAEREVAEEQIQFYSGRLSAYDGNKSVEQSTPEPVAEEVSDNSSGLGFQISFVPGEDFFKTGNDPYRILRELAGFGHLEISANTDKLPSIDQLDPEVSYLSWDLRLTSTEVTEEEVRELFEWVEDDAEINIQSLEDVVDTDYGEADAPEAATESSEPVEKAIDFTQLQNAPEVTSMRVNIDRVDLLVNLVGELVITQSMLSRFKDHEGNYDVNELVRGIEQLEENTRELQEHTMRIRMLPIDNVFQRMPRLIRDLGKSLGKEIELVMNGNSTEVDKTVLEKISDPLTHLVRNSLDHGIETPDERLAAGKNATGRVEISAYHEGGNIVIEVSDDGRGLDREAIYAKAVERGVIEDGVELTDGQIDSLIFSAGFSTAEQVSDVSGRGVGMDVVRNNIEQLNGHVDVVSTTGKGSTFVIKLPLTLAIIEGQLVRVGTDVFVVPLLSIVKSTRIDEGRHNVIGGESNMFRLDEEYLPIVALSDVYQIKSDHESVSDGILCIVDAVDRFGILVDEVLGQQQVVVKSLETNFKQVPTISGATILGDGTVAMILDMAGLLREARAEEDKD